MKKNFTKFFRVVSVILFLLAGRPAQAQLVFTHSNVESGNLNTGLTKDASGNIYVIHVKSGTSGLVGEVVKYTNGTGTGVSIYSLLSEGDDTGPGGDLPWGIAVVGNDVYVTTDFTSAGGNIIKLTYSGGTYTASTFRHGSYYSALAADPNDSNSLYTAQYDAVNDKYAVYKHNITGGDSTLIYDNLASRAGNSYPTGLAVSPVNGDVYVTNDFNQDGSYPSDKGGIIKLTKASSYSSSVLTADNYATALAFDDSGNLFATVNTGSGYKLVEYTNGGGGAIDAYTPLHTNGIFFPWGIAVQNSVNIFAGDGDDGSDGGAVLHLYGTPTVQAKTLTFSNITTNSATIGWTNGDGSSRVVFVAQTTSGSPAPVNSTTYTASTAFSTGTGPGSWHAVYKGSGNSVAITGLTAGTDYRVMVMEFNGPAGAENYLNAAVTTSGQLNPDGFITNTTVSSITRASGTNPTNATSVDYTVTLGRAVTGLSASNFSVTTTSGDAAGTVSAVSGTGPSYTVTVNSITGDGDLRLDFANSTGLYPAVSSLPFTSGETYEFDHTPPSVVSIVRTDPSPIKENVLDFQITFSEPVTGIDFNDFTTTTTGSISTSGVSVTPISSTVANATINNVTGDGTLRLDLNNSGTGIIDAVGNEQTTGYTSGETYLVDQTPPSAPSTPDLAAASDAGTSSTDNVTNVTTPRFNGNAEVGSTVTLYDTDGSTVLGTITANGSGKWSIQSSTLAEGTHTITATATDAAGNVSSASSGLDVTIDTTSPTLAISSDVSALKAGETATITFTFSEDPGTTFAWDGSSGDVTVSGGTLSAISGSGLTRTATFTPTASTNGGTASITVTAASYTDAAGNDGGAGTTP
ncbi:MAG TPA: Ig-like domain-containing protein, partial [Mucilaginibacter sp.]|nr:Ig-like domain-containing protein [Mucilaginibacter sp.]